MKTTGKTAKSPKPVRKRNPEQTQERIFAAATRVFAERGFDAARVDSIAHAARTNKQLIYHYFGSKDALFTAVLERAYLQFRAAEAALTLDALPADEAVLALVEFTWDYYLKHPEFIRLLNSENQMKARHLRASPRTKQINASHISIARRILARGKREGTIRPEIDVLQLNTSIAALGFFYLINRHTLSTIFARDLASKRMLRKRLKTMKEIIGCWIRPQKPGLRRKAI
jgi:AcrR family transcriptional regulator